MKNSCIIILFFAISPFSFSQFDKKVEKKILKIIGTSFSRTDNFKTKDFSYRQCKIDTSMTLLSDTSGIHLNNEFVIFRDPMMWWDDLPEASYLKSIPVSVKDYYEFMKYVADSIKIERIINSFEDQIMEYTTFNPNHKDAERLKKEKIQLIKKIKPSGYIDFRFPIDLEEEKTRTAISSVNLQPIERFYEKIEVDERKLFYKYVFSIPTAKISSVKNEHSAEYFSNQIFGCEKNVPNTLVENLVPISPDYFRWGANSKNEFDIYESLSYTYRAKENKNPVFGLTGMQALAFCDWKASKIQASIDSLHLPYQVHLSLPQEKDVLNDSISKTMNIPATDMTTKWSIKTSDYKAFVDHILDSIAVELLYTNHALSSDKANKLIHYTDVFFDEGTLTYEPFNSDFRELNISIFNLNYDNLHLFKRELDSIKKGIIEGGKIYYKFYKKDFKNMNKPGKYLWNPEPPFGFQLSSESRYSIWNGDEEYSESAGEEVDFQHPNCLGFLSDVKWFENLQRFNISCWVNPLENIDYSMLVQNELPEISYEQAKAYYIWKYKLWAAGEEFDYSKFIFPTPDEFLSIQKGKVVKIPEMKLKLPTPTFRYVVHFYKR